VRQTIHKFAGAAQKLSRPPQPPAPAALGRGPPAGAASIRGSATGQSRLLWARITGSAQPRRGGAFVKLGYIETGQNIGAIVARHGKLMNEIDPDISGEVLRIFVENGQPDGIRASRFSAYVRAARTDRGAFSDMFPENSSRQPRGINRAAGSFARAKALGISRPWSLFRG